jgi:hypothetical protein
MPGERGDLKWYFSNLPADTPLHCLVELAHSRWSIAQFYGDAKGECGPDHYRGQRCDGLHRHLALVMLAYSFLTRERERDSQHSQVVHRSCYQGVYSPGMRTRTLSCGRSQQHGTQGGKVPIYNMTVHSKPFIFASVFFSGWCFGCLSGCCGMLRIVARIAGESR